MFALILSIHMLLFPWNSHFGKLSSASDMKLLLVLASFGCGKAHWAQSCLPFFYFYCFFFVGNTFSLIVFFLDENFFSYCFSRKKNTFMDSNGGWTYL